MRLVSTQATSEDLLSDIKTRFDKFNALSSRSKGRRYPQELVELVQQAIAQGVAPKTLRRLTGVSATAMSRWGMKSIKKVKSAKLHKARTLEITRSDRSASAPAVLIRLPSGVVVEFSDVAALGAGLLNSLATLEVAHVTSR